MPDYSDKDKVRLASGNIAFSRLLLVAGGLIVIDRSRSGIGVFILIMGVVATIGAAIYLLIILYRLGSFIINQSNQLGLTASIKTPGQAVGYLFIPFYNLYWIFQVYGKMALNINAVAKQRGATQLMPEGLGGLIPVLLVATIVPYIGSLISLVVGFVLMPIFLSQAMRMCDSICVTVDES